MNTSVSINTGHLGDTVSLDLEHGNKVNTAIKCGEGNPLQYSGLENPMDGGAW